MSVPARHGVPPTAWLSPLGHWGSEWGRGGLLVLHHADRLGQDNCGVVTESSRVVIRAARAADDAALQRIDAATWSSAVSPAPPPRDARSFFDATTADEVLVAEFESQVAGYVELGRFYKLEASAHVLELKGLAVDPGQQRRGIGRLLIDAAIDAARRRKARRIVLRVLESNPTARRLYEKCGFEVEGILHEQFLLNDRYVDDVFMALDLTSLDWIAPDEM